MANCCNCEKKLGFGAPSRKIIGRKLCTSCCDALGINNYLTTDESAYPDKHFSSADALIQALKERKPMQEQMAAAFKPTRKFTSLDNSNLSIEIDEQSQLICTTSQHSITNQYSRKYYHFSDYLGSEKSNIYYLLSFNFYGKKNSVIISAHRIESDEALSFINGIKK